MLEEKGSIPTQRLANMPGVKKVALQEMAKQNEKRRDRLFLEFFFWIASRYADPAE